LRRFVLGSVIVAFTVLTAIPTEAALIRLTPQGLSPSEYNDLGLPTDPALITADGFRLTYHGGGGDELVNPVMLILGIPDLSLAAPTLAVSDKAGFDNVSVDLGDTQTRYGGTWNTTTGFAGTFSNLTDPKVYNYIGFTPKGSDSENYTNWSGATGLTQWNLFVYAITFDPQMEQGDYVEFNTSLPVGSYVIGYGCEAVDSTGKCTGKGTTESTPFTFAGMVPTTRVPEPATVGMLLPVVGFFAIAMRRRLDA
jgi:hypothetical protein